MNEKTAPAPLPPEEIERLKTLLEKATSGPWSARIGDRKEYPDSVWVASDAERPWQDHAALKFIWSRFNSEGRGGGSTWDFEHGSAARLQAEANAHLVAAMRNALPALLAEIEAGRAGAARVRELETDAAALDWIDTHAIAVSPQCNGGWVIEDSEPLSQSGDADVIELCRTREGLRRALHLAMLERDGKTAALRQAAQPAPDMVQQHEKQLADWVDAHPVFGSTHGAYMAPKAAQPADGDHPKLRHAFVAGWNAAHAMTPNHSGSAWHDYWSANLAPWATPAAPAQVGAQPAGRVEPFTFLYLNYKGEIGERRAVPMSVRFGSTEWHPEPQWLLRAFDLDKQAEREFAMNDMLVAPPVTQPTAGAVDDGGDNG